MTNLAEIDDLVNSLSDEEAQSLIYDWSIWARKNQIQPRGTNWFTWLILAGRGFGKTRTGAEWTIDLAKKKYAKRIAIVGPTISDVRDVMIEGESGILACSPPWFRPEYKPSKRHKLIWPNGVVAFGYSAEEPERLRGPQHGAAWCDEAAAWKYPETMDMLEFGLRLGNRPIKCVTTTPKPTKIVRDLLKASGTFVVRGTTFDNKSNLAPIFMQQILDKYGGTRLGRQELYAEMLEDSENALWKRSWIDEHRAKKPPELVYIVVGIDPAVTSDKKSNETGIVAVGRGVDGRYYVLSDVSLVDTPEKWSKKAVDLGADLQADALVGEVNNGGDLVKTVINMHDNEIPFHKVWASRGKQTRAEPISMLYEQGKVSHVGTFAHLEDEMCTWNPVAPEFSPNRIDALVWAITYMKGKANTISEEDFEVGGLRQTAKEYDLAQHDEESALGVNYLTQPDF